MWGQRRLSLEQFTVQVQQAEQLAPTTGEVWDRQLELQNAATSGAAETLIRITSVQGVLDD